MTRLTTRAVRAVEDVNMENTHVHFLTDRDRPDWVPGGYAPRGLIAFELHQAKEDGRDPEAVATLEKELEQAKDDASVRDIYARLLDLPVRDGFPFEEPDDLESIRALRPAAASRCFEVPDSENSLFDRLYGGWLGACAGCTLGGPSEAFRPWTRKRLKAYLTAVSPDEWPITDYIPERSPSDVSFGQFKIDATRERLQYVPQDDDLTWPVVGQIALQSLDNPLEIESRHVAAAWFNNVPYKVTVGGTGMLAYRNLVLRYPMWQIARADPEAHIDWHWVATHSNPYREDIDAGIRADSYGYAAPGMPEIAAGLAWQDARISNVKNGIYCSMFYAAMIAAACALDDPETVVAAGLAEIPATSRLYDAVTKVIDICKNRARRNEGFEEVHADIYETLGDDHNSTPCNVALVVSALLMGDRDFEKVITYTVMGGFDSDTTGATAGAVAGAMLGARQLPGKWIDRLNDTIYCALPGYHPIAVSELARRSVTIARKVLNAEATQSL